MECLTLYRREKPDTVNGHKIVVTEVFSSFDETEITKLEEMLKETVGSGLKYHVDEVLRNDNQL